MFHLDESLSVLLRCRDVVSWCFLSVLLSMRYSSILCPCRTTFLYSGHFSRSTSRSTSQLPCTTNKTTNKIPVRQIKTKTQVSVWSISVTCCYCHSFSAWHRITITKVPGRQTKTTKFPERQERRPYSGTPVFSRSLFTQILLLSPGFRHRHKLTLMMNQNHSFFLESLTMTLLWLNSSMYSPWWWTRATHSSWSPWLWLCSGWIPPCTHPNDEPEPLILLGVLDYDFVVVEFLHVLTLMMNQNHSFFLESLTMTL